jgi:hypothetical protein
MGFSLRKSIRLLPGVRINLSKSGPRLSFGIRGARASVGLDGKTNLYGSAGPIRYRKTIDPNLGTNHSNNSSLFSFFRSLFR